MDFLINSQLIYDFLKSKTVNTRNVYRPSVSDICVTEQEGRYRIKYDWNDFHSRTGSEDITVYELELLVFAYDSLKTSVDDMQSNDESSKHY